MKKRIPVWATEVINENKKKIAVLQEQLINTQKEVDDIEDDIVGLEDENEQLSQELEDTEEDD